MAWMTVGMTAMGALGSLAGGQGSKSAQGSARILAPASQLEKDASATTGDALKQLQQMVGAGAGQQDMTAGLDSTRQLASLLGQYQQSGGYANTQDMNNASAYTNQLFAGQQQSLNQGNADALTQANRQAAAQGRMGNDPILMAKLAQQKMQGQQSLEAQKTSSAGQMAQGLSDNRLNYASQLSQVNQGLATQAMANRQALLSAGQGILQGEQSFRAGTSGSMTTQTGGGGTAGAISGGLAGLGAGAGAGNSLASIFGGTKSSNPFNGSGPLMSFMNK